MKKMIFAFMAVIALCACKGEREYLDFRGLSLGMSAKAMCDSLLERGFALDSNLTDNSVYVLFNNQENARVDITMHNDTISDVLESYEASYNDSTLGIYNARHKEFTELYGWANMKHDGDLHKEANFQVGDKGGLELILLNTYSPTVSVRYSVDQIK
ncbi:hypothetical protein L6475_12930 [Prevotella sp. E9-3]|uniref:hypothetical protein n=1 Tax=Prevotella sp. E9-3 TaxID=2913621 RepID=UPI001EDC5AFA|nr:hypothetical protein [Prevotella sp. E9-3]UKK48092.1 hypothetical protein L6475_12930 [Prevotella sp. E9-3]